MDGLGVISVVGLDDGYPTKYVTRKPVGFMQSCLWTMKLLKMWTKRSEISQFVMWPCLSANQKAQFSQILREIVRLHPPKKKTI